MKTLRYLLIAMVAVLASAPVKAQLKVTDKVEYQFSSTSTWANGTATSSVIGSRTTSTLMGNGSMPILMRSGSRLPIAARNGVIIDPLSPNDNTPAYVHMRRAGEDDGFEDENPDEPEEPFPVGDGTWPLLLMAMAYCAYVAYRKVRAMRVVRVCKSESALEAK